MERRNFLKLAFGVAAGSAAFAAGAQAAPLLPQPLEGPAQAPAGGDDLHPAVTNSAEVAQLKPELVHWHGRGHHWGWRHRHWGWRHRHWGWRHRWHRRHWHRW